MRELGKISTILLVLGLSMVSKLPNLEVFFSVSWCWRGCTFYIFNKTFRPLSYTSLHRLLLISMEVSNWLLSREDSKLSLHSNLPSFDSNLWLLRESQLLLLVDSKRWLVSLKVLVSIFTCLDSFLEVLSPVLQFGSLGFSLFLSLMSLFLTKFLN